MKTLHVSKDGRVSFDKNLDGVETHIFDKATDSPRGFYRFTLINAIAERLGFTVTIIPDDQMQHNCRDPFGWLDLRYGGGGPFNTPEPANGRTVRFVKVEGDTSNAYRYELDPEGLSPIERDLISLFLPRGEFCGGTQFDRYFQMHIRGAAEVARRLGLKPKFEEEIQIK